MYRQNLYFIYIDWLMWNPLNFSKPKIFHYITIICSYSCSSLNWINYRVSNENFPPCATISRLASKTYTDEWFLLIQAIEFYINFLFSTNYCLNRLGYKLNDIVFNHSEEVINPEWLYPDHKRFPFKYFFFQISYSKSFTT
jgi:hypothetical protein